MTKPLATVKQQFSVGTIEYGLVPTGDVNGTVLDGVMSALGAMVNITLLPSVTDYVQSTDRFDGTSSATLSRTIGCDHLSVELNAKLTIRYGLLDQARLTGLLAEFVTLELGIERELLAGHSHGLSGGLGGLLGDLFSFNPGDLLGNPGEPSGTSHVTSLFDLVNKNPDVRKLVTLGKSFMRENSDYPEGRFPGA